MSIILQKYKNKRRLGKGAYGDVLLVEDLNGKQFAIKMISKKVLKKDPYLEQYLEGEKQCMMSVKSPYIMELISVQQDQNYIYFVCQYCDGGDLLNYQAKQEKKVFTMKMATKILSEVIIGLQLLHEMDYLHRDIKPQNILLKKIGNQSYQFKLADFGFAKKTQDVGGTVLGTQHYMSPQIYSNDVYGFQVDMWAFGVLMYFMLNMQFPFRHNPHLQIQQKREELIKQASVFSYSEAVKRSKKKILQNCTPEAQDLFKRIFVPDGQKRITFAEIRQHPLFRQHFPNVDHKSKIIYNPKKSTINRYDSFVIQKKSMIQPKNIKPIQQPQQTQQQNTQVQQPQNITPSYCLKRFKSTQQKQIVQLQIEKINFLYQSQEELSLNLNFLDPAQILALRYNLLKYYVILLREYFNDLRPEVYQQKYPACKWKQFFKTPQFKNIKKQLKQSIDQSQIKISQTYDQCRNSLAAVRQFNPKIQLILQPEVSEKSFDGKFKQSYRGSTGSVYAKVRQKLSNGNRYVYLTLLTILCHIFNQIMCESESQLQEIFKGFVLASKSKSKIIDFNELRSWLSTSQKSVLKDVILGVLKRYLSS